MGTPKGRPLSTAHKESIRNGMLRRISMGYKPKTPDWSIALAAINALPPEAIAARSRRAGDTMRGRPQPKDADNGANTHNVHGRRWHFYNKAEGRTLLGDNLNQLLRDHADWFDPKDIAKTYNGSNRAATCLRKLSTPKTDRDFWKGWQWLGKQDIAGHRVFSKTKT